MPVLSGRRRLYCPSETTSGVLLFSIDLPVGPHKNLKKQFIDYIVDQTREAIELTDSYGEVRDGVKYLRIISACHNFQAGLKWGIRS